MLGPFASAGKQSTERDPMKNTFDRKLLSQIGLLTGIGVLVPAAGTAEATVISQTQTFTVSASPAEVTDPGTPSNNDSNTTTVTFNQFDPSLGTLTEIDLALNSTLFGFLSVSGSNAEQNNNSTATWKASITLTAPDGVDFSDSRTVSISCDFGFCSNSSS